jgi:guanine deaminase
MEDKMRMAIEEARRTMNEDKGGPFGAVITDLDGNIISVASNLVLESHDPTAHAEVMAIRRASEKLGTHDLSGCILYATGYPCPMCLSAIIWANIKKVYYGTNLKEAEEIGFRDDFIYEYIFNLKNNNEDSNILRLNKMDRDETIKVFNEYKNRDDNQIY